jgi:hypothetical protein
MPTPPRILNFLDRLQPLRQLLRVSRPPEHPPDPPDSPPSNASHAPGEITSLKTLVGLECKVLPGGIPDELTIDASTPDAAATLDQLPNLAPTVRILHIKPATPSDPESFLDHLNRCLDRSAVDTVCFDGTRWGDTPARVIAGSPAARKLKTLRLVDCGMTDDGAAALFRSSNLRGLEELDLTGNRDVDQGFADLVAHLPTTFPRLKRLILSDCDLMEDDTRDLAARPELGQLTELCVISECLSARGIQELLDSPHCKDTHVIFNPDHLPEHARAEVARRLNQHNKIGTGPAV